MLTYQVIAAKDASLWLVKPATARRRIGVCRGPSEGGDKKKDDEATTYSSALGSTIGAWELNGRVRNGNGCGLPAIITSSKSTGDLTMG